MAKIYRWTDAAGRVHFTDNPGTIPPARREPQHALTPDTSAAGSQGAASRTQPTPGAAATTANPKSTAPASASLLQQQATTIEQQIAAALEERRTYLEQLKAVRKIQTNPRFPRKRRRVDTWGRALAAVEQRLDALYAELHQLQAQLPGSEPTPQPTSPPQEVHFDAQGHDALYWRRRAAAAHERLDKAQEQRQAILTFLTSTPETDGRSFGRRGAEVLQQVQALEQVDQEMRAAEEALQSLRQEATRAGAPAAWLQ